MIQLDNSFLIRAIAAPSAESALLAEWIRSGEDVAVSAVAWAEFLAGPVSHETVATAAALLGQPEPFTGAASAIAARLFNERGRKRKMFVDCLIAGTAISCDASVATCDMDFSSFESFGVRLAPRA